MSVWSVKQSRNSVACPLRQSFHFLRRYSAESIGSPVAIDPGHADGHHSVVRSVRKPMQRSGSQGGKRRAFRVLRPCSFDLLTPSPLRSVDSDPDFDFDFSLSQRQGVSWSGAERNGIDTTVWFKSPLCGSQHGL
jgi:hypothetical protein